MVRKNLSGAVDMTAAAAAANTRLGRGLASLIGDTDSKVPLPTHGEQRVVPIDQIHPSPLNPRRDFPQNELEELALSIGEKGLVQPLIVRPRSGIHSGYEIVAGERRWRASQIAEVHMLPVIVRELTDQDVLEMAIIENIQRADLNVLEEAQGYQELIEKYEYTQEELAQVIGKSRSHVANTIRLLKLPLRVQTFVREGLLSAGHARALIGWDEAESMAQEIVERGLNVRDVEALIQKAKNGDKKPKAARGKDPDTLAYEKELADMLGLDVQINPAAGESGEIRISYKTLDQLEDVCDRLMRA